MHYSHQSFWQRRPQVIIQADSCTKRKNSKRNVLMIGLSEQLGGLNFLESDGHSQSPFRRKGFQLSYYRLNHIKLQNSRPFFSLELPKGEAKKIKREPLRSQAPNVSFSLRPRAFYTNETNCFAV